MGFPVCNWRDDLPLHKPVCPDNATLQCTRSCQNTCQYRDVAARWLVLIFLNFIMFITEITFQIPKFNNFSTVRPRDELIKSKKLSFWNQNNLVSKLLSQTFTYFKPHTLSMSDTSFVCIHDWFFQWHVQSGIYSVFSNQIFELTKLLYIIPLIYIIYFPYMKINDEVDLVIIEFKFYNYHK